MNRIVLFLIFFSISDCCHINNYHVDSKFYTYQIQTTLDSEIAKYYLEHFLKNEKKKPEFDSLIDELYLKYPSDIPSRENLVEIAKKTSIDFAGLYFSNKVILFKNNKTLQDEFLKNIEYVKNNQLSYNKSDYLILLVPGYDYKENGHVTGADFKKPINLLMKAGLNVKLVDIDPIGSVEENAKYLTDTIRKFPNYKIIVAGASSAGPAIHLSLGNYLKKDEIKRIKAWLNLGGILQGVPVLDQFSNGFKGLVFDFIIWIKRWKKNSFESMQTEVSRSRFKRNHIPEEVFVLNYLGMSLSGDISKFASDKYCLMLEDGPNDGLSLLPDLIAPNSHTILAPKSDHFFAEDPEIDLKTLALLKLIFDKIESNTPL